MPRPTKLTAETAAEILDTLREGNTVTDAATAAGIHPSTLHEWVNRGEAERDIPINPTDYTKAQLLAIAEAQRVDFDALGVNTKRARKATLARHIYQPTPFTEFADAYTRAKAERTAFAIRAMRTAGQQDWRMWAHFLACTAPEQWSRAARDDAAAPIAAADPADIVRRGHVILKAVDGTAQRVAIGDDNP